MRSSGQWWNASGIWVFKVCARGNVGRAGHGNEQTGTDAEMGGPGRTRTQTRIKAPRQHTIRLPPARHQDGLWLRAALYQEKNWRRTGPCLFVKETLALESMTKDCVL